MGHSRTCARTAVAYFSCYSSAKGDGRRGGHRARGVRGTAAVTKTALGVAAFPYTPAGRHGGSGPPWWRTDERTQSARRGAVWSPGRLGDAGRGRVARCARPPEGLRADARRPPVHHSPAGGNALRAPPPSKSTRQQAVSRREVVPAVARASTTTVRPPRPATRGRLVLVAAQTRARARSRRPMTLWSDGERRAGTGSIGETWRCDRRASSADAIRASDRAFPMSCGCEER